MKKKRITWTYPPNVTDRFDNDKTKIVFNILDMYPVAIGFLFSEPITYGGGFFYSWDEHNDSLIVIDADATLEQTIKYLSHEISHAVEEICEVIGENLKGESRAYLNGYLMKLALTEYEKQRKGTLNILEEK